MAQIEQSDNGKKKKGAQKKKSIHVDFTPMVDMNMLLILNATSLQLLPTTVLAMRTAAGTADSNAVLIPTILCTACSTFAGVVLGRLCRSWEEKTKCWVK